MAPQQLPRSLNQHRRALRSIRRLLIALPAMTAGLLLMVFLLGGLGHWEPAAVVGWLTVGGLSMSVVGERVLVRVLRKFRRLRPTDQANIEPVLLSVLNRCGLRRRDVDLYACRQPGVNAFATGRRSIALTHDTVRSRREGRLSDEATAAMISHEIGHLTGGDVKWALLISWFAAPWRAACRVAATVALPLVRRQPRIPFTLIVATAFAVAITQAILHNDWASATVLGALLLCPVICPICDAATSRSSEHAADQYAAQFGYGDDLAQLLQATQIAQTDQHGQRLLREHPPVAARIRRLQTVSFVPSRPSDHCAV